MSELKRSDFPEAFNGQFRPALTDCRCPKCGSKTLTITETIEAFTEFQVVDGRLNREDGVHEFGGWIGRLIGHCSKCDHGWKFRRKATQIEDVVTELDPETFRPLYEDETPSPAPKTRGISE